MFCHPEYKLLAAKEVREDENLASDSCNKDNNAYCDPNKNPRIKWHEFDWKSYIAKDLKPVHRCIFPNLTYII